MRQKLIGGLLILLIGALIWYLFLKPYDYQVTFRAKTNSGIINQSIKLWAKKWKNSKHLEQKDWEHFAHQLKFNDSTYTFEWNIKALNDSISQIKVHVTDVNHSFANRIAIPFSKTDFEKRTIKTVKNLQSDLIEQLKSFKVSGIQQEEITPKFCAYIPFEAKQTEKALEMMRSYSFLSSVMLKNKFDLDGPPFIEIKNWKKQQDSISFNFCYPIIKPDSLPEINQVFFKEIKGRKAIKAVYNGNYITSDRAWYTLLNYAENNNIAIEETPIEIFHNNPNIGGDELKWKAEIYMPLK